MIRTGELFEIVEHPDGSTTIQLPTGHLCCFCGLPVDIHQRGAYESVYPVSGWAHWACRPMPEERDEP